VDIKINRSMPHHGEKKRGHEIERKKRQDLSTSLSIFLRQPAHVQTCTHITKKTRCRIYILQILYYFFSQSTIATRYEVGVENGRNWLWD